MRILIVNSLYTPDIIGGAEISTQILAETLVSAADVHVLTVGGQKRRDGVSTEKINGVTVHRLPCNNLYWIGDAKKRGTLMKTARKLIDLYNPLQTRAVRKLLAAIQPDVIHTQNLAGFGAGIWTACTDAGVPVVHTLRDYSLISPVSSPIRSPMLSRIYQMTSLGYSKRVSAVVGISSHIMRRHTDAGLFPGAARLVIPNVVDGQISGSEKDFTRKPLHIGYFGRIEGEKGVCELIEAIRALPHEIVEHVTICGDGGLRQKLLERCRHDDRFVFTGKVPPAKARELMAGVDVTFVPSVWEEPFGRVIIESYQVGTPVYASAVGGIPDAVWHPDEFLFPPGNVSAIREKMMAFYSFTGEEKKRLQAQCLSHCRRFTKSSLLEQHLDLYELTQTGRNRVMFAATYGQVN